MTMLFALAGNPNSGKTTLFNALTGQRQHVGNWPGVTVDKKQGEIKHLGNSATLVDLPGTYSLNPHSGDEAITRDFLLAARPDCVIVALDVTNLERNLYLALQLAEMDVPMVVALNMADELERRGQSVCHEAISRALNGAAAVPIAAKTGLNVPALLDAAFIAARSWRPGSRGRAWPYSFNVEQTIVKIEKYIGRAALAGGVSPGWAAIRIIEGDPLAIAKYAPLKETREACAQAVAELESLEGRDAAAILADERYALARKLARESLGPGATSPHARLPVADRLLLNRYWGLPIFFALMFLVFEATFGPPGQALSSIMARIFSVFGRWLAGALGDLGAPWLLQSAVDECLIGGVGGVLAFLPQALILFFFLSVMEDTGYMARAACMMDRALAAIGLSGRAFIPMVMGLGCTVPALMATRALPGENNRRLALMVTQMVPCGARLPVYALFAQVFFDQNRAVLLFFLYVGSIAAAAFAGFVLSRTVFRGKTGEFIMEMPPYRMPTAKSTALHLWEKLRGFVLRTGTVILLASVCVWALKSFAFGFIYTQDAADSLFGHMGRAIAPMFKWAGFNDWRAACALLSGLVAKEAVASTISVLYAGSTGGAGMALAAAFDTKSALCFLVFTALYTPCAAALCALWKELKPARYFAGALLLQFAVAYGAAAALNLAITLAAWA